MSTAVVDKVYEELRSTYAELFLYKVRYTEYYSFIQELMKEYKADRRRTNAISLFTRLVRFIKKTDNKDLIDEFNKCLVKEALIPKMEDVREQCRQLLTKQGNAVHILQKVSSYFPKNPEPPQPPPVHEQMTEQIFLTRLHSKPHHQSIIRITDLYLKCIINVSQMRSLLSPYLTRSELLYFIDNAQDIQSARRKGTSFVPLNELPEASFVQRMGVSYVEMPACYAKKFDTEHLLSTEIKAVLNDKWVSVPLGSEHVSFNIMRKNCYEDELFKNQDEKFELDHTVLELRRVCEKLQKLEMECWKNKLERYEGDALVKKILFLMYGAHDTYNLLREKPQAVLIVKPRVEEKLKTLERSRQKATKQWEDISVKNFHKSLDHRSFYFRKNEKKYNCTGRWDKELEFRQSLYGIGSVEQNDKESKDRFNDQVNVTIDTFQNVTRQKCIPTHQVPLTFPPIPTPTFPPPPSNKVLFVMQFSKLDVLSDLGVVLNQFISKKNLLQYLMLKMFNLNLKKILQQSRNNKINSLLKTLDGVAREEVHDEDDLMLERRERKKMIDENQEFEDLIEEEIMPIHLKDLPSPFEGPAFGHVFYGTKTHYYFLRYVLTLYQRFVKAKELAQGKQDDKNIGNVNSRQRYDLFKAILTHRLKDPKLQQHLRKLFGKDAYLFLSLDKIILGTAKLINNCDELSSNIIKQDTKDYQHQIRPIESFKPKSQYHQLLRLYHENTSHFRFCFAQDIMYVYSWSSVYKDWRGSEIVQLCDTRYSEAMTEVYPKTEKGKQNSVKLPVGCEYSTFPNHLLIQPVGEEFFSKRQKINLKSSIIVELQRKKRIKLI